MAGIADLVVRITGSTSQYESSLARASMKTMSFKAMAVGATTAVAAGFAAIGGGAVAGGVLKLAADAETLAMQMKVLTGSSEKAASVMSQLNQFAASTPFETQEIGEAARKLLAFGSSSDVVFDQLRNIGDIAAATGNPISELAELYGKAQVQGRLFGEDINQLTGRGIPIIGELAKQFKVNESAVKGLVEKGKIGFPELQKALQAMTGPGGKFGGMMAELSTTTSGKFSTFVDNVKLLGTEIGNQLLPYANSLLDWATNMVGGIDGVGTAFGSALTAAGKWFTAAGGYIIDFGTVGMVVAENFGTAWQGMFEDIQNMAGASLVWLETNFSNIISNIISTIENAHAHLVTFAARQRLLFQGYKAEDIDKVLTPATSKPMQALTEFKMPELSSSTTSVLNRVSEALQMNEAHRLTVAADALAKQQTAIAKTMPGVTAGTSGPGMMTDKTKGESKFSGAMQRGSQEAYSALLATTTGANSPQVKATQKVEQAITRGFKGMKDTYGVGGLEVRNRI